jgi:hypothetical protein
MPMPSKARNKNKSAKVGERPAAKLQNEYHRIEIIRGVLIKRDFAGLVVAPDD